MADDRYYRIWRNYADLKQLDGVVRTGLARAGVYSCRPDGRTEEGRSESDSEHTYSVLVLFDQIEMYCPEEVRQVGALRCRRLLLYHEYGEIEIGDIPDDGRRDEAAKNRAEFDAMARFCEKLPVDFGVELLKSFVEFQSRKSRFGQLTYSVDKLDFVLGALLCEQRGRFDPSYAMNVFALTMSDLDREYALRIGSKRPVDIWCAHFLDLIKDFECAPVFVNILRVAVENVRGKWFRWADEILDSDWLRRMSRAGELDQ